MSDIGVPGSGRPRTMRFRPAGPKLAADAARRQGEVVSLAFLLLGGRDAAIEFLNNPHRELGGRPIDLAVASADGAGRVTQVLRRLVDQSKDQ